MSDKSKHPISLEDMRIMDSWYASKKLGGTGNYSVIYYVYNSMLLKKKLGYKSLKRSDINNQILSNSKIVTSSMPNGTKPVFRRRGVCFASLTRDVEHYKTKTNRKADTVAYDLSTTNYKFFSLTDIAKKEWLLQCSKNGLLPKNISVDEIINKKLFMFNPYLYTSKLIYVYLCSVRNIVEEPLIVLLTLDIMKKFKHDFMIAYAIAEQTIRINAGHSFVYFQMVSPNVTMGKNNAIMNAMKIKKFLLDERNKIKKDKRGDIKHTGFHGTSVSIESAKNSIKSPPEINNTAFSLRDSDPKEIRKMFNEFKKVNGL